MCSWVTTPDVLVTGVDELIAAGWQVRDEDIEGTETVEDWLDGCLCGVDVEAVLDRSGVKWWHDPFGYTLIEPTRPDDIAYDRAHRSSE